MLDEELDEIMVQNAEDVVNVCLELEVNASKGAHPVQMNAEQRAEVASIAQEVTTLIASKADTDAIIHMLEANPQEIPYSSTQIEERRNELIETFYESVRKYLLRGSSTAGAGKT